MRFRHLILPGIVLTAIVGECFVDPANASDEPPLADYFGFEPLEVVRIGRNAGPVIVADMNGNGLNDLVIVNNHLSRIEIHYQKENASPEDTVAIPTRVNEFPEHWRYRRETTSLAHRVTSLVAHDFDGDGLMDIIYIGHPSELVFVRQRGLGEFHVARRHRVRNLSASRGALAVADVIGDEMPELLALAGGELNIWPMEGDRLGQPTKLTVGGNIAAFMVEDFSGNGRLDIAAAVPDDAAPIRVWFAQQEASGGALGPQVRFEMPAIREMRAVRLPDEPKARFAVIEAASKRLMIYRIEADELVAAGTRDAPYIVHAFPDPGNRKRHLVVADLTGNGLLDVVTTDTQSNAVVVFRQLEGKGLQPGESFPSLADVDFLAVGRAAASPANSLFALSEREGVVGRSAVGEDGSIGFPQPLSISEGFTPVAMRFVKLNGEPRLAVLSKSSRDRDHILELLDLQGSRQTIEMGSLVRSPETIVALDAGQNGTTDLLLFTRDRPMTMLQASEGGFTTLESQDMGQFGLVQAARAENTAVFDIDGNGHEELLIADRNYIRAVRYDPEPGNGLSPGWQVVAQINATDPSSQLISLAVLGDQIIAADRANDRLVVMGRESAATEHGVGPRWREIESINVQGFSFTSIHAGSFSGDGEDNILAIGNDGFAVVRLAGERLTLRDVGSWRSTDESQLHHHLAVGDINSDGFVDLVALDAGEQMCDIFTFTAAGRLLYATGFRIYESRIFSGGAAREYQPSHAIIGDVTGNGANDLILVAHDRILIYPQVTRLDR